MREYSSNLPSKEYHADKSASELLNIEKSVSQSKTYYPETSMDNNLQSKKESARMGNSEISFRSKVPSAKDTAAAQEVIDYIILQLF